MTRTVKTILLLACLFSASCAWVINPDSDEFTAWTKGLSQRFEKDPKNSRQGLADLISVSKLAEALRVISRERELANLCPDLKVYCRNTKCSSFELFHALNAMHNLECVLKFDEAIIAPIRDAAKSNQELKEFYQNFFILRNQDQPITQLCSRLRDWVPSSGLPRFNPRTEVLIDSPDERPAPSKAHLRTGAGVRRHRPGQQRADFLLEATHAGRQRAHGDSGQEEFFPLHVFLPGRTAASEDRREEVRGVQRQRHHGTAQLARRVRRPELVRGPQVRLQSCASSPKARPGRPENRRNQAESRRHRRLHPQVGLLRRARQTRQGRQDRRGQGCRRGDQDLEPVRQDQRRRRPVRARRADPKNRARPDLRAEGNRLPGHQAEPAELADRFDQSSRAHQRLPAARRRHAGLQPRQQDPHPLRCGPQVRPRVRQRLPAPQRVQRLLEDHQRIGPQVRPRAL